MCVAGGGLTNFMQDMELDVSRLRGENALALSRIPESV